MSYENLLAGLYTNNIITTTKEEEVETKPEIN